jgi:nicotine blue oxidoreductase
VLAAGQGRRLGGVAKALLPTRVDGPSFVQAIWASARQAGATTAVVVVAEPFARAVGDEARRLGLQVATNPEPARGMGSSVATGFTRVVDLGLPGPALLWPVDHAFVAATTVRRLVAALGSHDAVIPDHRGRGGHPVVVHRRLWSELAGCSELAEGARTVLRAPGRRVLRLHGCPATVRRDVDVPADLPVRRSA